jgi:probable phosphoglycerate mutase
MKIYFLRHGQRGQGKEMDTLLPEGIEQAKKSAKVLKNFKIEKIISGTSNRAKDTAKEIIKELNVKIEYSKEVNEKEMGIFEGKTAKEWREAVKESGVDDKDFRPKEGENLKDFKTRAKNFYEELKEEKISSILIISHSGFICEMLSIFFKKPREELENSKVDFGSITFIEVDENFNIKNYKINDISHLNN